LNVYILYKLVLRNILFACLLRHYLLQYTDFAAITFREGSGYSVKVAGITIFSKVTPYISFRTVYIFLMVG